VPPTPLQCLALGAEPPLALVEADRVRSYHCDPQRWSLFWTDLTSVRNQTVVLTLSPAASIAMFVVPRHSLVRLGEIENPQDGLAPELQNS